MRRALVLAAFALAISLPARGADWKSVAPAEHAGKTSILVSGKTHAYYRFESGKPLRLSVDGPTQLKLLTRLVMPNADTGGRYAVTVLVDGAAAKTDTLATVPAEESHYAALDSVRPGAVRRVFVDVPSGTHGVEIRAEGAARVDARVFRALTAKTPLVSLAARRYGSVEALKTSTGKDLDYYLLTKAAPIALDVTGPTTIKVNTRLLYDHTMIREQVYTVGVSADGGPASAYRIETRPSTSVTARERSDQLPGALRDFRLEVGKGRHTYEFRLVDAVAEGLAIKFLIPRGDAAHAR